LLKLPEGRKLANHILAKTSSEIAFWLWMPKAFLSGIVHHSITCPCARMQAV